MPADPTVTVDIRVLDTRSGDIRTIPVSREPFARESTAVRGLALRLDGALAVELAVSRGPVDPSAPTGGDVRIAAPGATTLPAASVANGGCPFDGRVVWQTGVIAATTGPCSKSARGFVVVDGDGRLVTRVDAPGSLAAARREGGYYLTGTDPDNPAAMIVAAATGQAVFTQVLSSAGPATGDAGVVVGVASWGYATG